MQHWEIHPQAPAKRVIAQAVTVLTKGGILVYPTDTTYAMGVPLSKKAPFMRLCTIRCVSPEKSLFSVFLSDVSQIGHYALGVDTPTYRLLRQLWPGLYTVILRAGLGVPRHLWHRQTIGFRVTSHPIVGALLEGIGEPLVNASIPSEHLLRYAKQVEGFLDAGLFEERRTSVIDLSQGLGQLRLVRRGDGSLEPLSPWLLAEDS